MLAALAFLVAANLHPGYKVRVGGVPLDGSYSRRQIERCQSVSAAAAEEILGARPALPELRRDFCLSLRPLSGDSRLLTDAILCGTPGVETKSGVYVNGLRLGSVEDGDRLYEALRAYIRDLMPNCAVYGNYGEEIRIKPLYGPSGGNTDVDDMVLLVSGMAKVLYRDADGLLIMG